MKYKQQAAPEYTTTADGQRLVHVALANTDQRATLYAGDYQRWLAAGFSPFWSLTSTGGRFRYVLAAARSVSNSCRSLTVARWIADAGKGQRVSYIDGDRLNLCRENLELAQGPAKAAAAWLRPNDGTPARKVKRKQAAGAHTAPVRPALSPQTPATNRAPAATTATEQAPVAPRGPHTAPVIDMGALAERVRQRVAAGVSYNGGTSR